MSNPVEQKTSSTRCSPVYSAGMGRDKSRDVLVQQQLALAAGRAPGVERRDVFVCVKTIIINGCGAVADVWEVDNDSIAQPDSVQIAVTQHPRRACASSAVRLFRQTAPFRFLRIFSTWPGYSKICALRAQTFLLGLNIKFEIQGCRGRKNRKMDKILGVV